MHSPSSSAWNALCAAFAAACIAVWLLPVEWQIALRWRADHWRSEPWTLWTASLTHLSDTHLIVNLLALCCLAIMGSPSRLQQGCGRDEAMAALIAWPVSTGMLLIWPQVQFYAGFSGLNHALSLVFIAQSAMQLIAKRQFSAIAFLLAVMLTAKIIWESPWTEPLRADASWGFTVVQAAHLTGLLAAALASALVYAARIFFTKAVVE